MLSCSSNNCGNQPSSTISIDTRMLSYVFKEGSYFVYSDTADGVIDSQYVYSYSYRKHVWIDSAAPFQPSSSNIYCGPYYDDVLYMKYYSYYNGVLTDSFISIAEQNRLSLSERSFYSYPRPDVYYGEGYPVFYLDQTRPGLIGAYNAVTPQSYYVAYLGQQSVTVAGVTSQADVFRTVAYGVPRYINTTIELFMVKNIGIVKIIEHRQTGDVSRDLLRYHIAN